MSELVCSVNLSVCMKSNCIESITGKKPFPPCLPGSPNNEYCDEMAGSMSVVEYC